MGGKLASRRVGREYSAWGHLWFESGLYLRNQLWAQWVSRETKHHRRFEKRFNCKEIRRLRVFILLLVKWCKHPNLLLRPSTGFLARCLKLAVVLKIPARAASQRAAVICSSLSQNRHPRFLRGFGGARSCKCKRWMSVSLEAALA